MLFIMSAYETKKNIKSLLGNSDNRPYCLHIHFCQFHHYWRPNPPVQCFRSQPLVVVGIETKSGTSTKPSD